MPKPIAIPVRVEARAPTLPADSLESRLLQLALPLRNLSEAQVRDKFALGPGVALLKTTVSLCPDCLAHVHAAVFVEGTRVLMAKHCPAHGASRALIENDERYYRLSNKDRWGRCYAPDRIMHIPEFAGNCCGEGESCAPLPTAAWPHDFSDQRANKSCTVLVEITDACNLACGVCYADSKGDKLLPYDQFRHTIVELVKQKGGLDSIQITGGEAAVHPQFWEMLAFLHAQPGIAKIYLPTNGIAFVKPGVAEKLVPFKAKLLVLLQFDGADAATNRALRNARPERIRERLLERLNELDVPMQLTMTLASDVNEREIAWVVSQGVKYRNVRLVALQPTFYSGRYELPPDPMRRLTLSDAVKGVALGMTGRTRESDFMPIPCSHPNCGWVTLFVHRFGLFFNIARHVDLDKVMDKVAYKTQLGAGDVQGIIGTRPVSAWQRLLMRIGRKLVRPRDVFGVAIKPFMDRFSYDQDRISSCCHHILDTHGNLASFCEYNARLRAGDSWQRMPSLEKHSLAPEAIAG
jgi:7,8-dihydro-6-hydroxymethylpterin dimethyltransferase